MRELEIDEQFSSVLVERQANVRWKQIDAAADYIATRLNAGKTVDLMFVCTHNSRRSQFAHVWAEVWARKTAGLEGVRCYSGGTEVTACNERTIGALERFGFEVESSGGENPNYRVKFSNNHEPVLCNSSLFAESGLTEFAAMMCCSDVDQKCPTVVGAEIRVPLHYEDPKSADDTDEESSRYDERCEQIGRDMMLLMHEAASRCKQPEL